MKNLLRQGLRHAKHKLGMASLEQKIGYQSALAYLALPDILPISAENIARCNADVRQNFGITDFIPQIHKNDMMLHYRLHNHNGNLEQTLRGYFKVGADILHKLQKIVQQHGHDPKDILDFGCGYGRVSRFWPHFFKDAEISVSDIKRSALAFQSENFGFNSIAHTADPLSFPTDRHYHLILALSVFTHLPKDLFFQWLRRLCSVLSPGGILVFTYNDIESRRAKKLLGRSSHSGFNYLKNSEEVMFPHISDSNPNVEEYGHAFASKNSLQEKAGELGLQIHFLDNSLVQNQEAAILEKPKELTSLL